MYKELNFSQVKATGWSKRFLENQAAGLTGEIGNVGKPFSLDTWGAKKKSGEHDEQFLGGMETRDERWVPYEQNGYWIDGMIRAGHLIDDEKLIRLAGSKIYPEIEMADEDGYIGPSFLKNKLTWAHAVYFRALMAEYTATKDERIIEALKKHFLRRPIKEVHTTYKDVRILTVRNIAEIETTLWLYGQTGDKRFLTMSEESYEEFNRIFSDDTNAPPNSHMRDVTLPGMLQNRKVNRNHGVTYCEVCKLAAILHLYTGKEVYKEAAVKAFDKVYRDQMLIDGVFSSTEYLNGNEDSWAMHETCDISDFTWALGYLFMITGDRKYGDWVEDAIFNAGLGAVDDDFKGEQYFSCPNQVIANDNCNHAKFFRGREWMSYAPKELLACCAGNVHRFMPNFVHRSWMQEGEILAVFTYTPCEINVKIGENPVRVEEVTEYPFENTVRLKIHTQRPISFTLALREPSWATATQMSLNGNKINSTFTDGICKLTRVYCDGDEIVLSFTDEIKLIENAKGISVKKGPLLYALPVEEEVVIEGLRELGNPDFPRYSLYPKSQWNYGLCVDKADEFSYINGDKGEEPWRASQNGMKITVAVRELPDWKIRHHKKVKRRPGARTKCQWEEREAIFMPQVRPITEKTKIGEERQVTLIPYGMTRLRLAIFPIIN